MVQPVSAYLFASWVGQSCIKVVDAVGDGGVDVETVQKFRDRDRS